jgi:ribosome-binding factor A
MTTRMERVEETLRRAIADVLLIGGLRDPRLQGVNFSVTGVKVDADLTLARVFVDILSQDADEAAVLAGLRAAAAAVRHELRAKVQMRRLPNLRFERDNSIQQGLKVEQILAEIRDGEAARNKPGQPEIRDGEAAGNEPEQD